MEWRVFGAQSLLRRDYRSIVDTARVRQCAWTVVVSRAELIVGGGPEDDPLPRRRRTRYWRSLVL